MAAAAASIMLNTSRSRICARTQLCHTLMKARAGVAHHGKSLDEILAAKSKHPQVTKNDRIKNDSGGAGHIDLNFHLLGSP